MRRAIKAKLKIKLPDYCTCPKCFDTLPDEVKNNYNWPLLISYIKRYYNYFENDGFYRFDTSDQNKRFVTALLEE